MLASACAPLLRLRAGLPPLDDDADTASLRTVIERTRPVWVRSGNVETAAAADRLLAILDATADPRARREEVTRAFRVVRVRDPLLLTAYYEPELAGRLAADPGFTHPLYARPPDLVDVEPRDLNAACRCRRMTGRVEDGRLRPYPTRGEIDAGALAGRGLEIAWAADPIDLFVLHVQGSGRLRLPDGTSVGVRYAGSNGRPYRSIVHALVARGLVPKDHASLADIRHALGTLTDTERAEVMATDERYTFFRLANGGPIGSLGVELTPGRSIAADSRVVPPGALAYVATRSVHRLVVSQDAGAAIRGAHADLFLGLGPEAEARAGSMHEQGTMYLLLPRTDSTPPPAPCSAREARGRAKRAGSGDPSGCARRVEGRSPSLISAR
jgi:membrane-bound lytic murein transglycosylase A